MKAKHIPGRCLFSAVFVFCALFFLQATNLAAQIHVVGGLSRNLELSQGEESQGRLIVRNTSGEPRTVRIYLTDYQSSADGGTRYGEAGLHPRSNAAWIHLVPREQEIPAEGSASFHFVVRVPEDAGLSGTYWSMLMVEPLSPERLAPPEEERGPVQVGIRTITRTGIHLITRVGSGGHSDMRFLARSLEKEGGRLFLRLDMENTGECRLNLTVWVELFDEKGFSIGRFSAGQRGLYPGSSSRVRADLSAVPAGTYQALVVADNHDDHVFGARYLLEIPHGEERH